MLWFFPYFKLLKCYWNYHYLNVNDNHFYCLRPAKFNCLYFCLHFYKDFQKNITIESAEIIESLEEALFLLQEVPERKYSKICLLWQPFWRLFSRSQENPNPVLSTDKWFLSDSFYKRLWPVNCSYAIFLY